MPRLHIGGVARAVRAAAVPALFGVVLALTGLPAQAQMTWSLAAPAHRPPPRAHAAAAYDAVHDEVVVFGGDIDGGNTKLGDTWVWNGVDWTQRFPATGPGARNVAMMAFDAARGRIVMFGGVDSAHATTADTWEWDGAAWVERFPAHVPPPHCASAMAFDASRGEVVLFGGTIAAGSVYGDTWVWNGTDWTERLPANAPSPRYGCAMEYDAARGRIVLFGGLNQAQTVVHDDSWTWDGVNWTQQSPAHVPPARVEHRIVYDIGRQRIVMQGGLFRSDTWEWNGFDWQAGPDLPHVIRAPAMVHDAARDNTVLFGGEWWGPSDETWLYGVGQAASYTTFGTGCPGWAGTPWLTAGPQRPLLGQTFQVSLYNLPPDHSTLIGLGWSNTSWQGNPLPVDLAPIGAPGCSLLISPDLLYPVFNWAGHASWSLGIPNQPTLAGFVFCNQAVAVDHANALGLVFTNGGIAVLGTH